MTLIIGIIDDDMMGWERKWKWLMDNKSNVSCRIVWIIVMNPGTRLALLGILCVVILDND
jgi:hypothetical protein